MAFSNLNEKRTIDKLEINMLLRFVSEQSELIFALIMDGKISSFSKKSPLIRFRYFFTVKKS